MQLSLPKPVAPPVSAPHCIAVPLADDGTIPNNPLPLLLYPGALGSASAAEIERLLATHGWGGSWRNGVYSFVHYHSTAHEVLGCFCGSATVQFGGPKGVTVKFSRGDAVLIPAGVAHQNLSACDDFAVVGAYPQGQRNDMCYGKPEERQRALSNIARVPIPDADPILGARGGLKDFWARPKKGLECGSIPANAGVRKNDAMKSALVWFCAAAMAVGSRGEEAAAPAAEAQPPTHTVARGSVKSKVNVEAVFEAVEMTPVKVSPRAWFELTVLDALPQGARVKKGDSLAQLDTKRLEEQIEDMEKGRAVQMESLKIAEAELANLGKTTPLKLQAARRAQRVAREDLAYFEEVNRTQREKSARFGLKSAEQRLANEREELKQLEKMYRADDIREETEEIILKRQKFAVEAAEQGLESTRLNTQWQLKTGIPREHETLLAAQRDQEAALLLAEETLPRQLLRKRLEVEKQRRDWEKSEKRLADLKSDLAALSLPAPADGIVFYGACRGGRWLTAAQVAPRLAPGGKLVPHEIVMTIVNPDKLTLKGAVAEADLYRVRTGMTGRASATAAPDAKFNVTLEEISYVPQVSGGFAVTLSFDPPKDVILMPGMNCKVLLGESDQPDPLVVPKKAVRTENGQCFVTRVHADGRQEQCAVQTGQSNEKMIEILEGLAEGDKILLPKSD